MKKFFVLPLIAISLLGFISSCSDDVDPTPVSKSDFAVTNSYYFKNQTLQENILVEYPLYEIIVDIEELSEEVFSKGMINVSVSPATSTEKNWTMLPGNYTPAFETESRISLDVAYAVGQVILYTYRIPGNEIGSIDVKIDLTYMVSE